MKRRIIAIFLCISCLLCLAGCSGRAEEGEKTPPDVPAETDGGTEEPTPTPPDKAEESPRPSAPQTVPDGEEESGSEAGSGDGTENGANTKPDSKPENRPDSKPDRPPVPPASEQPATPLTDEEIVSLYTAAMEALKPDLKLYVGGRDWKYGVENDLKNLYYAVLSRQPALKYTYDMTAAVSGDWAECRFSYMPYKTGAYSGGVPAGSRTVNSLHAADVVAQGMAGSTERLPIAITDPSLEVEDLQRALGQAGYGWIVYSLSRDGTEITAAPVQGKTLEDCNKRMDESFRLAGEILGEICTENMTDREKVEAAYAYITENVAYDFRYYSGKNDMPYESTVALGALRDHLAICGGYAHALETLLDMCGIENYTVSGVCKGEYHAWNYVVLDGQGYYCDATSDRGGMRNRFLLTEAELTALGGYEWDGAFMSSLRR